VRTETLLTEREAAPFGESLSGNAKNETAKSLPGARANFGSLLELNGNVKPRLIIA